MRNSAIYICSIVTGALALSGALAHAGAQISRGPYLQRPSQTGVTVRFELEGEADAEATIRYGEGEKLDRTMKLKPFGNIKYEAGTGKKTRKVTGHLYAADLKDLKPGTAYRYTVEVASVKTDPAPFTTTPAKADEFAFIAYGDNRTYQDRHASVTKNFLRHDPAFILHSGDLIGKPARGGDVSRWPQFFVPLRNIIDRVPVWVAKGNHDDKWGLFAPQFVPEGGKTYYSFDYGDLHVAVLDSNLKSSDEKKAMRDWFEKDISSSRAAWKIVAAHHPFYNVGGYGYRWGREDLVPLFHRHGVDVVFSGHAHLYERLRPMTSKENPQRPVLYIIAAGGGAPLYAPGEHPYIAVTKPVLHYAVVNIKRNTIGIRVLTEKGEEMDRISWSKTKGIPDAEYVKTAKPREEWRDPEGAPYKEPRTLRWYHQQQKKKGKK
jgi:hypothetical protein